MNTAMLENAATQNNIKILQSRGFGFIYGDSGFLACGDVGKGRMAQPEDIFEKIVSLLFPKRDLEGKTVLITAGATREPIDPVRYITNRSSGKMGAALCDCAVRRGAKVILVAGSMTASPEEEVTRDNVSTTCEMYDAVMKHNNKSGCACGLSDGCRRQQNKKRAYYIEFYQKPRYCRCRREKQGK